jgi:hypothetical protein
VPTAIGKEIFEIFEEKKKNSNEELKKLLLEKD